MTNRQHCLLVLIVAFLYACSHAPSSRFAMVCPSCTSIPIETPQGFTLNALIKPGFMPQSVMHLYLEGDGIPWTVRNAPSSNPTSQALLALRLYQRDPYAGLYLNRPCYGQDQLDAPCHAALWTSGRYSAQIVAIMNDALDQLRDQFEIERFVLVGHSGGGTLALLIANRRDDVEAVITVAANIDHQIWTEHFGYQPLSQSLNPADEPPLSNHIRRWHLIGLQDQVVPADMTQTLAELDPVARVITRATYRHDCCWEGEWRSLIQSIHTEITENHSSIGTK